MSVSEAPSNPIQGETVYGTNVDGQTRCAHWRGERDIIAIRFHCCDAWFACYECHTEHADHPATVWPVGTWDTRAILCGACGYRLTINEYLDCKSVCPSCGAGFNPGCASHRHLYFETPVDWRPAQTFTLATRG